MHPGPACPFQGPLPASASNNSSRPQERPLAGPDTSGGPRGVVRSDGLSPSPGQVLAVAPALFSACTLVASVDPARDAGASFSPACAPCVEQACAEPLRACRADPTCSPLARCLAAVAPDDVAGRGACEASFATALGAGTFQALDACLRTECLDPCLGRRGLFGGLSEACQGCIHEAQKCGDEVTACLRDGWCERAYRYCFGPGQVDPSRVVECFWSPENALGVSDELQGCLLDCPDACPFRREWGCVGQYAWPDSGDGAPWRLRSPIELFRFGGNDKAVGVTVEVCSAVHTPCRPLSSAVVDPEGMIEVSVPATGHRPFRGYFRLTGEASVAGEAPVPIVREYLFLGLPVNRAFQGTRVLVFAEAEAEAIARVGAGAEIDPDKGHLGAFFLDCAGYVATGVTLELDVDSRYDHPTDDRRSTRVSYAGGDGSSTGTNGAVAFNIQPGCVEIVGTVGGVATHRSRVFVEKGAITYTHVLPLTANGDPGFDCVPGPR